MKINITIDPVIYQNAGISITWHGLCLAAGIIVVYLSFLKVGEKQGFTRGELVEFSFWALVSGLIFARIFGILENFRYYAAAPLKIFAWQDGGITVTGGALGVIMAALVLVRIRNLNPGLLADSIALAVPLGYIFGRSGCLILGDTWGLPTNNDWGLVYWHENSAIPASLIGIPTFPAPIIFQVTNLLLGFSFLILFFKKHLPGLLLSLFLMVYGFVRFLVAFWQPGSAIVWQLHYYQIIALVLVTLGALSLPYFHRIEQRARNYDW